ncbi:MAG TPA: hypothetical protein VGI79_07425 [Caulobacteraceae bacterium]
MSVDGFQLYDLLGVSTDAEAAALWPGDKVSMVEGYNVVDDAVACISALNAGLRFTALRLGSDPEVQVGGPTSPGLGLPGQITLSASAQVLGDIGPYYVRDLPNVGVVLLMSAADKAPTVFFARDGRGYEVLIEGLSVELQFPTGLITPAKDDDDHDGDASEFDPGDDDSVAVVKIRGAASIVRTHIRLHLTPDGDVIIEPNTPINIDTAKFSNLPVTALHDVLFIPSPRRRDLYEWTRNDLVSLVPGPPGMFGLRSVLFDLGKPPFADLVKRFQDSGSAIQAANVDLVLEDVVIPASGFGFPLPTHGTFGIRRKITDRNSIEQAYSLSQAPFRLRIYSRSGQADADRTGLYLVINQLEFRTGSLAADGDYPPVLEFQAQLDWQAQSDAEGAKGALIGVTDDWVVQLGLALGSNSPLHIMTVASADIAINAIKGGLRLTTFGEDPDHSWQALVDISVRDTSVQMSGSAYPIFKITTLTGKPLDVILRDVGWSFGQPQLGKSIAAPEGVQLVFGGIVRLVVEELGFIEEPAGGTYFSFSGGVEIGSAGGKPTQPSSTRTDNSGTGTGIRFRRLRFLTSDTPSAPPWKLDGILLDINYGPVSIGGFGYITDDVVSGYRYQEFGFGVQVAFPLATSKLKIAAEFLKGTSTEVAAPNTRFNYLLASLEVSFVPAGPLGLYALRALFAYDMQPALDPAGTGPQSMQLYQWHKDHDGALDMPRSRNLADWTPTNNSLAVGAAVGLSFNSTGQLFHIGVFVLVTHSDTDTGVLVVGDVYLLKNPDSIGFAAFDYDAATSTWGVMIGVNLGLDKFVGGGKVPAWIANLAKLTGTLYFGNNPGTFAIGQLSDQRSWMGITLDAKWLKLKARIAICVQVIDGGPKGFGAVASFTGGDDWGIGKFQVFGSIGFIWGAWKTGSDSNGVHAWAQVGFKMSVFYVFSVGMEIDLDLTYVNSPGYGAFTAQIHIDTPWFLPDVSFQFSQTLGHSQPFDSPLLNPPLSGGAAASPQAPSPPVAMHVPALSDGTTDPTTLYSFNQLAPVTGAPVGGVTLPGDLTPVAVDADIVLTFTNPLSNDAGIATQSFPVTSDPGTQTVQDFTVRYALKSVQIQRSPRFGPQAGVWTDLVAVEDTALDTGGQIHAAPAVSFAWDADTRADGGVSPSRLFINCRTPYSVIGSSQNDEQALGDDDGFPCCQLDPIKGFMIPWRDLSWTSDPTGLRLPMSQAFSDGGGLWSWTAAPATMNGTGDYAGRIVAVVLPSASALLGSVDLTDPAVTFRAQILPMSAGVACTLTAYYGLDVVSAQTVSGGVAATSLLLAGSLTTPITRVTLEVAVAGASPIPDTSWGPLGAPSVMVYDLQYQSLADVLAVMARRQRCRNSGATSGVGGAGKLAFLPNCDYAVTPTIEVTVSHRTGGSQTLTIAQPAFFRTKGLLGLNASPNVGDELAPYVASTYPPNRSAPLYRSEPVALAFTEGLSNLLPIDRVAAAGDPPEKAQLVDLALSVDRLASTDGALRLTAPGEDWLTAHGGAVGGAGRPPFRNSLFSSLLVRKAASLDVKALRFEAVLGAAGCDHDPLHTSQVLTHAPLAPDGSPGNWQAQAAMRATVRAQDGPYAERAAFVANDLGAFSYLSDGGPSPVWSLNGTALVAPGAGRHYAAFGDATWNYFQIGATLDPVGGVAGVGVGLSGSIPVQQAVLALIDHGDLVLVRREGGVDQEMARASLPVVNGPVQLHVTAFDDIVRASVGDVVVEIDRDAVREGRAALVADGEAVFSALLVESLDMYRVEFATSRYLSFADHVAQRDPTIYAHAADAMGVLPASTPSAELAARSADIAAAMTPAADPQQRQQLFAQVLSDIGLASLHACERLTLTRLTDSSGVTALLTESPEPLSFLHDVRATLLHRAWRRLPHPTPVGPINPITTALSELEIVHGGLAAPVAAAHVLSAARVQVLFITSAAPAFSMQVYDLPVAFPIGLVQLRWVGDLDAAGAQAAGLGALVSQPQGIIAAVQADHSVAGAVRTMALVEVAVTLSLLSNADETSAVMLMAAALAPGDYRLQLEFSRIRWETTTLDPASVYQDSATILFTI